MSNRKGAGVVWVTSYPKSGNTWMRFILTQLVFEGLESSADLERCIPNVGGAPGERIMLPRESPVMLKTHWTFAHGVPLFEETLGFVYMVRNPIDVMLSFFNFNLLRFMEGEPELTEEHVSAARAKYIDTFIQHRGNPLVQKGTGHTDWVENVEGWLAAGKEFPSVFVRYEDMLRDTPREVRRVLEFFRLQADEGTLARAIENSTFESMRKQEEKEIAGRKPGFFYRKSYESAQEIGVRFMRKGSFNDAPDVLTPAQRSAFRAAFGATLEKLGYRLDDATGRVSLEDSPVFRVAPLAEMPVFGYAQVNYGLAPAPS